MKNIAIVFTVILLIVSCKKTTNDVTQPDISNEEELITTVELSFIGPDSTETISKFTFSDVDGVGGASPVIDTIKLNAGAFYTCNIAFLDETKTPADNITEEVEEEGDEHLICFTSTITGLSFEKTDSDGVFPIGLESKWTHVGTIENGIVTITLKHQPGVKDGTCEPGETDVEVTFPVVYQ
jgi:hypothetical protein